MRWSAKNEWPRDPDLYPSISWSYYLLPSQSGWEKRHLGNVSHELKRILRPFGFQLFHYNSTTLRHRFGRVEDVIPKDYTICRVHRIDYNDCPGVDIDETFRRMKICVEEHLNAWWSGSLGDSASADHLITCTPKDQLLYFILRIIISNALRRRISKSRTIKV